MLSDDFLKKGMAMHHVIAACALWLTIAAAACAQSSPHGQIEHLVESDEGTVVCRSEQAMVAVKKSRLPSSILDMDVLNPLIERGECLEMPPEWLKLDVQDPLLDQQQDHASKWTIRTPQGIIQMWGGAVVFPLDRDVGPGSDEGMFACKTEKAMVRVLKAQPPPGFSINQDVMDQLIEDGDCLIMPRGWVVLEQQDPPRDQREDHAARLTIRTPDGFVRMWGTPIDED